MNKDTKTFINQENYVSFLEYEDINNLFCSQGYVDGYADFDSNASGIVKQLYKIVPIDDLTNYINYYLKGYYIGKDMSDMAEEIYDEDGNFKEDEYCFSFTDCTQEAINTIKRYMLVLK